MNDLEGLLATLAMISGTEFLTEEKINEKLGELEKNKESKNMELKDTIELMNSDDYRERFIAEYLQAKIRYNKLNKTLVKAQAGTLKFKLKCPIEVLEIQKKHIGEYINDLEVRAEIEGIQIVETLDFFIEEVNS